MAGSLGLSTPWTRKSISRESKLDVEAVIPDGWTLGASMDKTRGQWVFWTVDPNGNTSHQLRVSASMSLTSAAFYALRHWRLAMGTSIDVDAEGYIRSITDAD